MMAKPDSQPLMDRLKSWYFMAVRACGDQCAEKGIDIQNLGLALKELEARLEAVQSPLVFAHGDLQHGNIMMEKGCSGPKIFLIDYEYSLPQCPRGFDLANHFCEWGYDFNAEADSHNQQVENLPSQSQKETFCESYLIAQDGRLGWHPTRAEVLSLVAEADAYIPVSNLHWGLWGLVQATRNDCSEFDYGAYGAQRINSFLRECTPTVAAPKASLVSIGVRPQPDFVFH
jgi:thiamine kinase-like enzyme